jgi:hypothetical protein
MNQATGVIFCLAYILGLISTAVPWGRYGILALGIAVAIALPKLLRNLLKILSKLLRKDAEDKKKTLLKNP